MDYTRKRVSERSHTSEFNLERLSSLQMFRACIWLNENVPDKYYETKLIDCIVTRKLING